MSTCQDKDTVLMYQWPRGITVPCPSPFVLKLETYFRMANIKYKSDHSGKLSKKGKIPWIVVDGQAVADSSFVIQHLNKRFEVDLNQSLSSKDKAIAHSYIKMMEENTFWAIIIQGRYVDNFTWFLNQLEVPKFLHIPAKLLMKRRVLKAMWYQGIGRHSPDEIRTIGEADLQSCAEFLEEKPFFMGDQPTLVDATMFGFLAELAWHMPPDHWSTKCVTEKHKNLVNYCYRMKARYWPDWDDLLISKNK